MGEWPGKNHILCGGRAVVGPGNQLKFYLAVTALTLPWPFFLYELISFFLEEEGSVGPLVAGIVLMVFVYCSMAATAFSDPGILPRNPLNRTEKAEVPSEAPQIRLPGQKKSRLKFCTTCNIFRPPRASHCSVCNCCIQHFDHHCPWTGNCVGLRNYRYYLWFIFSLTVCCAYTCAFSLWHAYHKGTDNLPFLIADAVLAFYAFIAGGLVGGLSCMHIYLCSRNIKTYEQIKKEFKSKANPFDRGVLGNWAWWWLAAPRWPKPLQAALV